MHIWAYDFMFDACVNGQPLKCLTVIDEFTRECLAIDVASSIRSTRVTDVLARLITEHGAPSYLRKVYGESAATRQTGARPSSAACSNARIGHLE